tara:strand:+ start:3745 stop:6717 length:2973 start_codon:yes stop_codon:yes gene_type:complete
MDYSEIRLRIQTLLANPSTPEARTLRTDVEEAWEHYMLEKLSVAFQDDIDESLCLSRCETLLRDIWPLIQGTSVSYTARPDSELTQVLVDIAKLISPNHSLEKLMPDIALESFSDDYPDLQNLTIEQVLKTYVLSGSRQYLYPVGLIAELTLTDEKEALPYNPYYDYGLGDADQQINPEEWRRLTTHSEHTAAVMQAKANYQALSTQNHHLLGQLTTLIHQLALNDAHGGRGTSEDAAGQAYPALLQFKNYYEELPEEEISKIPDIIKEEIDLLLDVAFNPESSVRAQNPIQTCIGSRREALYAAIQGHEATLAGISMGEGARQGLIEGSKEDFDKAHGELKHAFENQTYTGSDNLGITPALLEQLGISVRIESLADMNFIVQGMEGQDLAELLAQDNIRSDVIQQLTKLEDLVIFVMETSNTKLPIVLHALEAHVHALIKTPQDLAALLTSLQVDKIDVLLQALSNDLPDIIKNGNDFGAVLKHLTPEQCTAVILAMIDKLPEIIKGVGNFSVALHSFTPEQCTAVTLAMSDKLPDIIKDGYDFRCALEHLTLEQRTAVYEAMSDKLPDIIQSGCDFGAVLKHLTPEQRTVVYDAMSHKLPDIIQSGRNFGAALEYLTPEQRTAVYEVIKEKFPDNIKNGRVFGATLEYLTPEQRTAVYEAMSHKLPDIIKNGNDFGAVLKHLTPGQCTAMILTMSDKLPEIITDGDEVGTMLEDLTPEQRNAVILAISDKLPNIIKNGPDFRYVLHYLTPEQRTKVYEVMSDKLPAIIENGRNFLEAQQILKGESARVFFDGIKEKLPDILKNIDDFVNTFKYIDENQSVVFIEVMKETLPSLVKNKMDFFQVINHIEDVHSALMIEVMKDKLMDVLEVDNLDNYLAVLENLGDTSRAAFYNMTKGKLIDMSTSEFMAKEQDMVEIFEELMDGLPPVLAHELYQAVIQKLPPDIELEELPCPPQITEKTSEFKDTLRAGRPFKNYEEEEEKEEEPPGP